MQVSEGEPRSLKEQRPPPWFAVATTTLRNPRLPRCSRTASAGYSPHTPSNPSGTLNQTTTCAIPHVSTRTSGSRSESACTYAATCRLCRKGLFLSLGCFHEQRRCDERDYASEHQSPGGRKIRVAADHRRKPAGKRHEEPDPEGRTDRHQGATHEQPQEEEGVGASLLPPDAPNPAVDLTLGVGSRFVQ
jgi:hypothetical protein